MNDGGNWVEDGYGNVVFSIKFLVDNKFIESEVCKKFMVLIGVK